MTANKFVSLLMACFLVGLIFAQQKNSLALNVGVMNHFFDASPIKTFSSTGINYAHKFQKKHIVGIELSYLNQEFDRNAYTHILFGMEDFWLVNRTFYSANLFYARDLFLGSGFTFKLAGGLNARYGVEGFNPMFFVECPVGFCLKPGCANYNFSRLDAGIHGSFAVHYQIAPHFSVFTRADLMYWSYMKDADLFKDFLNRGTKHNYYSSWDTALRLGVEFEF
jgi:hypothetical protein